MAEAEHDRDGEPPLRTSDPEAHLLWSWTKHQNRVLELASSGRDPTLALLAAESAFASIFDADTEHRRNVETIQAKYDRNADFSDPDSERHPEAVLQRALDLLAEQSRSMARVGLTWKARPTRAATLTQEKVGIRTE